MHYLPVDRADEFLSTDKPVILTGLTADWPAQSLWTLDFFRTRYGHLALNLNMTMAQYIDYVENTRDESPDYLASWDFLPEAPELTAHFSLPAYWKDDWMAELSDELRPRLLWLFIGPARSGFRMHVDIGHTAAWNAQLVGSKRWLLFPQEQLDNLYDGQVNAFAPDLQLHPKFRKAKGYQCTLQAGETLFVPSTWWHQTLIVETSIALSGNYANQHNIHQVLAWLRDRPQYAKVAEALRERLPDCPTGRAGPPSRPGTTRSRPASPVLGDSD